MIDDDYTLRMTTINLEGFENILNATRPNCLSLIFSLEEDVGGRHRMHHPLVAGA